MVYGGHMTWYILNTPDNIPSWDVMVASVWYILNVLNMDQFGMVLVLRPRPCNVLAMYQVSTSPLAPSVSSSDWIIQPQGLTPAPNPLNAAGSVITRNHDNDNGGLQTLSPFLSCSDSR